MATVEWQTTCTDLKQRGSLLLETEEWSDCTLLIGPEAAAFKSHKLMLAMASPVFESMFLAGASSDQTTFHIPDINPATFEALVLYIYTENINISTYKEAYELYLAANKYLIPQLTRVCAEFMCCNVSMETACSMYEAGHKNQDHVLMYESLQMIKLHIREILKHRSFEEANIDTVAAIFGIPDIQVEEMELFQALERYARVHSSRKRSSSPPPNQSGQEAVTHRFVRKALQQIRFLTFSIEQFAHGPAQSGLLSPRDALRLLVSIAGDVTALPPGFSASKQHRLQRPAAPPAPQVSMEGVLRVTVPTAQLRYRSHTSPRVSVAGRPWALLVIPHLQTDTNMKSTHYLGVYLSCEDGDPRMSWSCSAQVELVLLASGENKTSHVARLQSTFSSAQRECGEMLFMQVEDALSSERGFVRDNNLVFEARVTVSVHPAGRLTI